jgi:hypothetical protein
MADMAWQAGPKGGKLPRPTAAAPDRRASMCRNIKPLFNFDPPATEDEIRASALQFVRKISGIASRLIAALETNAAPRNREDEAAKAKARAALRYGMV